MTKLVCCNANQVYEITYQAGKKETTYLVCEECSKKEEFQQFIIEKKAIRFVEGV